MYYTAVILKFKIQKSKLSRYLIQNLMFGLWALNEPEKIHYLVQTNQCHIIWNYISKSRLQNKCY